MAFNFLHTADWQIGKPFRAFGDRLAGVLEEARLDAIDTLAAAARNAGAGHLLVAGDVFDAEDLPRRIIRQAIDRMSAHDDLTWHLLPGNHDPARPGGLWENVVGWGLPPHLRPHISAVPCEITSEVWLLPAPLLTRAASADPTAAFDTMTTPHGAVRIGLAHGSVKRFAGNSQSGASGIPPRPAAASHAAHADAAGSSGTELDTIDPRRAERAGLAYLALGDWHGMTRVDARTWYSGTPEPDRYLDNAPGHALAVTLDASAPPHVAPVATARYVWRHETIAVRSLTELDAAGERLAALAPQPGRLLLKLKVEGALTLDERTAAERWRDSLGERLRHLDADLDAIDVRVAREETQLFAEDQGLARVAEALADLAAGDDADTRARANRALLELAGILRRIERGEAA